MYPLQNTVETSTFGSEFVAMRIAVEMIEALQYKLRMFGAPIEGSAYVFCDNEAVTKNAMHPESTLKTRHDAIAYHRTREAVAAGTIRVTKEDGKKIWLMCSQSRCRKRRKNYCVTSSCIEEWWCVETTT